MKSIKNRKIKVSENAEKNEETTVLEKSIRKSSLNARDEFDYRKLSHGGSGLLNCTMREEKEELFFLYDIHAVTSWMFIANTDFSMQYAALMDIENLHETAMQYKFIMRPDNLYFDSQGRVYICDRDIYEKEEEFEEDEFIRQYKSLIGCTIGKKYKFDDYYQGGMDLLKEDEFLTQIADVQSLSEIAAALKKEYQRLNMVHQKNYIEVKRKKYLWNRWLSAGVGIISIIMAAAVLYMGVWEMPYDRAVMEADNAYMEAKYTGVIDALENVDVSRMDIHQKYILAVSYVKCESLSSENQKNILNTLSWNGDEKLLDYWIYLGRLDTASAEDVAMQESSDELLYYAYLKEKSVIENNTDISGEEKNQKISEINSKLQPLEEEYSKLMEDGE